MKTIHLELDFIITLLKSFCEYTHIYFKKTVFINRKLCLFCLRKVNLKVTAQLLKVGSGGQRQPLDAVTPNLRQVVVTLQWPLLPGSGGEHLQVEVHGHFDAGGAVGQQQPGGRPADHHLLHQHVVDLLRGGKGGQLKVLLHRQRVAALIEGNRPRPVLGVRRRRIGAGDVSAEDHAALVGQLL